MLDDNTNSDQSKLLIRFSKKAKRAIIYIKPNNQVELALPIKLQEKQYDTDKFIQNIMEKHKNWINKKLNSLKNKQTQNILHNEATQEKDLLPSSITLTSINETIKVSYHLHTKHSAYCLVENQDKSEHDYELSLTIKNTQRINQLYCDKNSLNQEEHKIALKLLQTWLKDYSQRKLEQQTKQLANEFNFKITEVKTRLQKTRLGSCTHKGVISLNAALLFFLPELTRHLILHELAHLKEMNHGQNFWKLLNSMDKNSIAHDKKLKKQLRLVPSWVLYKA